MSMRPVLPDAPGNLFHTLKLNIGHQKIMVIQAGGGPVLQDGGGGGGGQERVKTCPSICGCGFFSGIIQFVKRSLSLKFNFFVLICIFLSDQAGFLSRQNWPLA